MARSRFCRVCKDFHDLNEAWPADCLDHFGPATGSGPFVISDNMPAIRSQADGRMYDSKSSYRRELRARGCYEVGNDSMAPTRKSLPPVREALRQTLRQLG